MVIYGIITGNKLYTKSLTYGLSLIGCLSIGFYVQYPGFLSFGHKTCNSYVTRVAIIILFFLTLTRSCGYPGAGLTPYPSGFQ